MKVVMTEEQTKSKEFSINQLLNLKSQIDFTDRSYVSGERWGNDRRAEYVLRLLLGRLEENEKITLYVKNLKSIEEFDSTDHTSVFVGHQYIPAEPGYEELSALYRYVGYYNLPEDEYGLDNAIRRPMCNELLLAQQHIILHHREEEKHNPKSYTLSTMYSCLPQSYQKEILNTQTTVIFRVLPSAPKNDDRVKVDLFRP